MEIAMNEAARSAVFFPGAGSFGREFRLLVDELKPAAWLARYPGRYGRDFGTPAGSFDELVLTCAGQVTSLAPARPVLFGHSFGAYVAFATALKLQETATGVGALVVAGACAPGRFEVSEQATGTPSEAARYLESVDPGALADAPSADWREVVGELTVQDLRLLRQFDATRATSVHCPILAARGQADPLTSDSGVAGWERYTDGIFSHRVFPGGHSDFLRSTACLSWIRETWENLDAKV
jgi:surfactin synthase thioesterase subunit